MMASTTAEPQSADSTKDVEVSSSSEQSSRTSAAGDDGPAPQTFSGQVSDSSSSAVVQPPQIKNNQQIRTTGRNRSHQSDEDEDEQDDDSNDCGGNVVSDAATSSSGPNNNGFHDESSGGSTSSGSKIPAYSSNNSSSIFNAPICSPSSAFQSSSSKSNPFSTSSSASSIQQRPILRPSAFKFGQAAPTPTALTSGSLAAASSSSPFVLRPPKLIPTSSTNTASASKQPAQESDQQTPTFVPLEKEASSGDTQPHPQAPVPLAPQEPVEKKQESAGQEPRGSGSFVFGSNLKERVIPSDGVSSTTGAVAGVKRKMGENEDGDKDAKKASVVEEGEAQPLLPQQVITGEEDEVNVLQIQCRLFIFVGTTSSWIERGRGLLRLNDSKDSSQPTTSRLIIRTKGSLRVMLNTKVWEGMRVEKAGDKSIRLMAVDLEDDNSASVANNTTSASDAGSTNALRIFLIMTTSLQDAFTLTSALESRVRRITQEEGRK